VPTTEPGHPTDGRTSRPAVRASRADRAPAVDRLGIDRAGVDSVGVDRAGVDWVGVVEAPPGQASDDEDLAQFAQSIELALVVAYRAGAPVAHGAAAAAALAAFERHHRDHAAAVGRWAGARAVAAPNRVLAGQIRARWASVSTEHDALNALFSLENAIAATYQSLLERATSGVVAREMAMICPVEAQHAVVIGTLLAKPTTELVPLFEKKDGAFDPARYSVT